MMGRVAFMSTNRQTLKNVIKTLKLERAKFKISIQRVEHLATTKRMSLFILMQTVVIWIQFIVFLLFFSSSSAANWLFWCDRNHSISHRINLFINGVKCLRIQTLRIVLNRQYYHISLSDWVHVAGLFEAFNFQPKI